MCFVEFSGKGAAKRRRRRRTLIESHWSFQRSVSAAAEMLTGAGVGRFGDAKSIPETREATVQKPLRPARPMMEANEAVLASCRIA